MQQTFGSLASCLRFVELNFDHICLFPFLLNLVSDFRLAKKTKLSRSESTRTYIKAILMLLVSSTNYLSIRAATTTGGQESRFPLRLDVPPLAKPNFRVHRLPAITSKICTYSSKHHHLPIITINSHFHRQDSYSLSPQIDKHQDQQPLTPNLNFWPRIAGNFDKLQESTKVYAEQERKRTLLNIDLFQSWNKARRDLSFIPKPVLSRESKLYHFTIPATSYFYFLLATHCHKRGSINISWIFCLQLIKCHRKSRKRHCGNPTCRSNNHADSLAIYGY